MTNNEPSGKASDENKAALVDAATTGNLAVTKELLDAGARPNILALFMAVSKGHSEILKLLLAHGGDSEGKDMQGQALIMHAAVWGNVEVVKILLAAGANPEAKDKNGGTALSIAVSQGHLKVVEELRKAGAS